MLLFFQDPCLSSTSARKIINATFNINPACNGGLSHQYEEVVRNKAERMHMDAGDCENCRDVRLLAILLSSLSSLTSGMPPSVYCHFEIGVHYGDRLPPHQ